MKSKLQRALIFIIVALTLQRTEVLSQGWTETEKKSFKDECLKNLVAQQLSDVAKPTCDCILSKFIVKFPRAVDAAANGERRLPKITLQCLPTPPEGGWHPLIQRQFFETCMELSLPKSYIHNAKDFCLCMVGKFQMKYKQEQLLNLNEIDKATQMESVGIECNTETPTPTPER